MIARAILAALLAVAAVAHAQKQTVCTITVNSPDEREVFRRNLPEDRYDFVELVERGRPDWLAASCRGGVRCDVLLVSGHFAGTEFYSSRPDARETLPVDVLERASCSDSCPGLFSQLKEVYLFGCDTLNPTPVRNATPEVAMSLVREGASPEAARREAQALAERHGESALEHMRRLFPGVPVIYGFSSKAPYGRFAAPMLERLFQAGSFEPGSGRVNERLYRLFAPASMAVTQGLRDTDPNADYRAEACRYHDERLTPAAKLAAIRASMTRSMAETRLALDRIEKFLAGVPSQARREPAFAAELASLSADAALRARFLALAHDTPDPAVRVRLIALGDELGWLSADERRIEQIRMVGDLLASGAAGFGEVELICALNQDRSLDAERARLAGVSSTSGRAADAALACLGDSVRRTRTLQALASRDEREVQIVQAYLRHRPITDPSELRTVALEVARASGAAAQARALEALARQGIADGDVFEELTRLFARTRSLAVQRAVAEIFIRSGHRAEGLAETLRRHRLRSSEGADVIDAFIAGLSPARND
jgi:hypothetical protein